MNDDDILKSGFPFTVKTDGVWHFKGRYAVVHSIPSAGPGPEIPERWFGMEASPTKKGSFAILRIFETQHAAFEWLRKQPS